MADGWLDVGDDGRGLWSVRHLHELSSFQSRSEMEDIWSNDMGMPSWKQMVGWEAAGVLMATFKDNKKGKQRVGKDQNRKTRLEMTP